MIDVAALDAPTARAVTALRKLGATDEEIAEQLGLEPAAIRRGGWPKGKPRSATTRAKMSAASNAAWADPAVRAKMSAASKAAWADPAVRAKMSAARKAAWADPAVRAKISAACKAALADPAVRAKMSAARKAALADPAVRAKMSAARKAAWADPAVRAKMSAASKAALADPAVRAKMSAAQLARHGMSEAQHRQAVEGAGLAFDRDPVTRRGAQIYARAYGLKYEPDLVAINAHRALRGEFLWVLAE